MKRSLNDSIIKHAKPLPNGRIRVLSDGGGLSIQITTTGKYWRYRYRIDGKQPTLALGTYPDVSLKDARELHEEARKVLASGMDPAQHKKVQKRTRAKLVQNSFEVVAREWFDKFSQGWVEAGRKRVMSRLERDIFPVIGNRPIAELEPPEILECLQRIEKRGALDTAHRARQDCSKIFRYAVATGKASHDQTLSLQGSLPPVRKEHFAAITEPGKIAVLMRGIDQYEGSFIVKCALQLSPLLFVRPGELRHMEWAEVDLERALWEIPASKMKMRLPHIVPLADQVLDILEELHPLTGNGRYVFPGIRKRQRPMSENTINQAIRRLGYEQDEMTAHGFRAMARTVLEEVLNYPIHIIELQLAHAVKDPNGRAYNRTVHLEKRMNMMQMWADYLDGLKEGGDILPFKLKTRVE
ncbi:MAG: integrase arm-type DNA-binding domain-containing protein [Thiolinea sp.]